MARSSYIRTFTRDAKAVLEREYALRLLRAVMILPPERPRRSSRAASHASPRRSQMSPRRPSGTDDGELDTLLSQRVALPGGLIRAVVSVAENPDDALRTVCMETLIEIGMSFQRAYDPDLRLNQQPSSIWIV